MEKKTTEEGPTQEWGEAVLGQRGTAAEGGAHQGAVPETHEVEGLDLPHKISR
jgi:hypothetical protein